MTPARSDRPLERAQLVWRKAVALSGTDQGSDRFVAQLELLRTAQHGPSTMRHALALGRVEQRAAPWDRTTRDAVHLLACTIKWLGRPTDEGEVGTRDSGPTPQARTAALIEEVL